MLALCCYGDIKVLNRFAIAVSGIRDPFEQTLKLFEPLLNWAERNTRTSTRKFIHVDCRTVDTACVIFKDTRSKNRIMQITFVHADTCHKLTDMCQTQSSNIKDVRD